MGALETAKTNRKSGSRKPLARWVSRLISKPRIRISALVRLQKRRIRRRKTAKPHAKLELSAGLHFRRRSNGEYVIRVDTVGITVVGVVIAFSLWTLVWLIEGYAKVIRYEMVLNIITFGGRSVISSQWMAFLVKRVVGILWS